MRFMAVPGGRAASSVGATEARRPSRPPTRTRQRLSRLWLLQTVCLLYAIAMARPTKLTLKVQEAVVRAVQAGSYVEPACRAAGIAPSTYYRWIERGERELEGSYADFVQAVRQAEAEAEVYAVVRVREAMTDDWRAAVAYLERRFPGRWRRHTSTELVGPDGGPIRTERSEQLDFSRLTNEDLARLEEICQRAAPQRD